MISGAVRGAGGPRLAKHLLNHDLNEEVIVGRGRGLASKELHRQLKELGAMSAHGRTKRPLWHLHADPAQPWSAEELKAFWTDLETEFDLIEQPFVEVTHVKAGRLHVHRVYSLVALDGRIVDLRHDYARREKISRIAEHRTGEPLVAGRHNRAVANALVKEGRTDVAEAMEKAGLLRAIRPAALTPVERNRAERLGTDLCDLRRDVWKAWRAADSAADLKAGIEACGYRIARGEKTVVVIDDAGGVHSLDRVISAGAKAAGAERPAMASVRARLSGLKIPDIEAIDLSSPGGSSAAWSNTRSAVPRIPAGPSAQEVLSRSIDPKPLNFGVAPLVRGAAAPPSGLPNRPIQKENKMEDETNSEGALKTVNAIGPTDGPIMSPAGLDITALLLLAAWAQNQSSLWLLNLVTRVERYGDFYAFVLTTSERIAIQSNRVVHVGEPTEDGAAMMVEIAKAKGWRSLQVQGSRAFQEAIVRAAVKAGVPIVNPELAEVVNRFRREYPNVSDADVQHPAWPPSGLFLDAAEKTAAADIKSGGVPRNSDRNAVAHEFIEAARARRHETDPAILKKFGDRMRALAADAFEGGYASDVETHIEAATNGSDRSYITNAWRDRVDTEYGKAWSEGRIPLPASLSDLASSTQRPS